MFCSSMLCVVCDNFSILIVDADTRRVVRTFHGHTNRITDVVRITMHFIPSVFCCSFFAICVGIFIVFAGI